MAQPLPYSDSTAKIDDIQTLRGVSILLVLVAHLPFLYPWADAVFAVVSPFGFGYGVDLFFVISGFVIARSLRGELARSPPGDAFAVVRRFWIRRVFRLWPAAALVVLATVLAVCALGDLPPFPVNGKPAAYGPAAAAAMFNYMNIWGHLRVIDKQPITLLAHYWSLSLEEQFYVVLPILLLWVKRRDRLMMIAAAVIALFCYLDRANFRGFAWWVRVDGLFWGVFLCMLMERLRPPRRKFGLVWCGPFFIGPIVAVITIPALLGQFSWASSLTLVFAAWLVHVASWNRDVFQQFGWFSRFLNVLGERSYTIYLWHLLAYTLVQLIWRLIGPSTATEPTLVHGVVVTLGAAIALCWVEPMYRWVETPTRQFGRRVARLVGRRDGMTVPAI